MNQKKQAALVLSGGGALGAAHIGALRALENLDFDFDFYAGVSAGALICALAACGRRSAEIQRILEEVNFFSLVFDFTRMPYALLRGNKVKERLASVFEDRTFADLNRPLFIGCTDFSTGERVILNRGSITEAVRASLSVPVLFEPFYHAQEERWLVDGGLTQNFPLDIAIQHYPGTAILGIDVTASVLQPLDFSQRKSRNKARHLTMAAQRAIHILLLNQQQSLPPDPRVSRIVPDLRGYTALDVFRLAEIIEAGEKAVHEQHDDLLAKNNMPAMIGEP